MRVVFPTDLAEDIKNGGYSGESGGTTPSDPDPGEGGGESGGGSEETPTVVTSYNDLTDLPKINSVELKGNKTLFELGLSGLTLAEMRDILDALEN